MKIFTFKTSIILLFLVLNQHAMAMGGDPLPGTDLDASLAQGCYSIKSPSSGKHLRLNSAEDYSFSSNNKAKFYFKPSSLGEYLLRDTQHYLLSATSRKNSTAKRQPSEYSEWRIAKNGNRYGIQNKKTNNFLEYKYERKKRVLWWTVKETVKEHEFYLQPESGCVAYPEMSVNAAVDGGNQYDPQSMRAKLKGDINAPVRGYMDAHSHLTADEFMGGYVIHGDTFHPWGVEHALDDCEESHGPNGEHNFLGSIAFGEANHDTQGWPQFPAWPDNSTRTHGGYYYKWLERAHLSGMRMIVAYLVENNVLCGVIATVEGALNVDKGERNTCHPVDSVEHQASRLRALEAYVDAQHGGKGKGFLKIVYSPQQARTAIAIGQLAIVMGTEVSETLDCGLDSACDTAKIDEQLDKAYDLGIRVMYPVHKFDNHFSGTSLQTDFINYGQFASSAGLVAYDDINRPDITLPLRKAAAIATGHNHSGYFFEAESCNDNTNNYSGEPVRGQIMKGASNQVTGIISSIPIIQDLPVIKDIALGIVGMLESAGVIPAYNTTEDQCNPIGLTASGEYLIDKMIEKKMIIDMDHFSAKAAADVMDIVEANNYSGVVSTHSWMQRATTGAADQNKSDDKLHETFKRMLGVGGFAAPMNSSAGRTIDNVEEYLLTYMERAPVSLLPYSTDLSTLVPEEVPGVGLGLDMGGLAAQASGSSGDPVYPFTTEFGVQFQRSGDSGGKTFTLADDGIAHYGMLPDHIQRIRELATQKNKPWIYDSIMNSAEAYIKMWERADNH